MKRLSQIKINELRGTKMKHTELKYLLGGSGSGDGVRFYCELGNGHTTGCLFGFETAVSYCLFWGAADQGCSCRPC